jgi:hypothetical protein
VSARPNRSAEDGREVVRSRNIVDGRKVLDPAAGSPLNAGTGHQGALIFELVPLEQNDDWSF